MRYLLDTHAMIWHLEADVNLSSHIEGVISHPDNDIYVSIVTLWEMSIKSSLGKLAIYNPLEVIFQRIHDVGFHLLPIHVNHLLCLAELPQHHRDPFDRLLIATAMSEDLTLLSADQHFRAYEGLKLLWN